MIGLPIEEIISNDLWAPLRASGWFMTFNIVWTFLAGEITGNYSQVDKVWTFLPLSYTIINTFYPLLPSAPIGLQQLGVQPRALLILALQLVWSIRLTSYGMRRGFYSNWSEEDYRWNHIRGWISDTPVIGAMGRAFMTFFNLFNIATFQHIALAMLGLPAYFASISAVPLNSGDVLLTVLVLAAIYIEYVADNQQYAYQTFKRTGKVDNQWHGSRIPFTAADRARGFITKGLWAYSRHPNFACEQTIWLGISFFPVLSNWKSVHDPISLLVLLSPALLLFSLFLPSTIITETISSSKYQGYQFYKARVGMFWPTDTFLKGLYLQALGTRKNADEALWKEVMPLKKEN
ncbi:DUF1295-domain-containing protein [Clavulina sp. PMI_390]|nr:DUF1295-domain-containing protein [Clavulina sp. PMI_390]